MKQQTLFSEAINLALRDSMREQPKLLLSGLGINDPGRFFGTTKDLVEEFGSTRVFETPTSENSVAGISVGAALGGYPIVNMHQRMDFFLLAFDQLVNSAAKWRFMFGDQFNVPVVFRLIVGRGWGQGPTHSQNFRSSFAQIPNLQIFEPSSPSSGYWLMREAIRSEKPSIFIEHRWLHGFSGQIKSQGTELKPIDVIRHGTDIEILSSGFNTQIALRLASILSQNGISAKVLDLQKIHLIQDDSWLLELDSTAPLIVIEDSYEIGSVAASIFLKVASKFGSEKRMRVISKTFTPEPTSKSLIEGHYPGARDLLLEAGNLLGVPLSAEMVKDPSDVVSAEFLGPF